MNESIYEKQRHSFIQSYFLLQPVWAGEAVSIYAIDQILDLFTVNKLCPIMDDKIQQLSKEEGFSSIAEKLRVRHESSGYFKKHENLKGSMLYPLLN